MSLEAYAGKQKQVLAEAGWLDEEVLAAGQLRQGKAPTIAGMLTGKALFEVLRPKRSKLLPRHFVMVATPARLVVFKASGGKGETASVYQINIQPGEETAFPRERVRITDTPEGAQSKGGILEVTTETGVERLPVARPNLNGDPDTDELLALLGA